MNIQAKRKIDELSHFFKGSQLVAAKDGNIELTITLDEKREAVVRLFDSSNNDYCDMDVVLRISGASYIYIISELEADHVEEEFSNIRTMVDSFKNDKYSFTIEKLWGFWRRHYLIFKIGDKEISLLRTRVR